MSDQLLSGNISFAGLGSGTDFSTLIDGLMKIEGRRITQLENWRKSWEDKITEFRDLNTKLLSLKTKLEGMNTMGKFLVKSSVSSNEAAFTATAGADASEGAYNITVNTLAKNSIWTSRALGSATTDIVNDTNADSKGSFSFDIDGKTITTTISEGQNLNDLAAAINANTTNRYTDTDGVSKQYVRASVVKTQSSPDGYVLQLSSLDQGTKYAISNISTSDISFPQTSWLSTTVGDPTANIVTNPAGGILSFDVDGQTITANIADGQSLNDLADAINADIVAQGLTSSQVRASVVQVSPGAYALRVQGANAQYTPSAFNLTRLSVAMAPEAIFTETQAAADAQVEFNGLTITRSSNVIDDIVPGITLTLKQANATGTLTVNTDKEAIKENVRAFVDAVNEVRTKIIEISKVDTATNEGSILTGNYGIDMIGQNLKNIIASKGIGFDYLKQTYSALPQLGITTVAEEGSPEAGLLTLDEEKLDEALAKDPAIVASLFSAYYEGSSDSPNFSYASSLPGMTEAGTYKVAYDVSGGTVTSATIGGYPATWDSTTKQLTGAKGPDPDNPYPTAGLVVTVTNLTNGSYSGNISLFLGKTNELINELKALTEPKSSEKDLDAGPLAVLEWNYKDIMDSIDRKIEYEERRISRLERQYKDRFARLDALLNQYNGIASGLQSQIVGMMKD